MDGERGFIRGIHQIYLIQTRGNIIISQNTVVRRKHLIIRTPSYN
jgi:hypothetical protein